MIYTVFFKGDEPPQDFGTYAEAMAYGEEKKSDYGIDYVIDSTEGNVV